MNSSFLGVIFARVPKDTASKNGIKTDFSVIDFRSYANADLHAASPSPAPSASTVFRWFSHLSGGNSGEHQGSNEESNKSVVKSR